MFSLAWFLCGLLIGRRLSRSDAAGVRPNRGRSDRDRGAAQRTPMPEGSELYVGNLSFDASEKDVEQMFGRFGKVVSVRLIENKFNGKSKGYGFVEMGSRDESAAAIRGLNGKEIDGRKIVVNPAKSRPRR
jgi:RNA recognition motif-containing protein